MIRLRKQSLPPTLLARIEDRIAKHSELVNSGQAVPDSLSSAYRDPDIKVILKKETCDKCAYCESKMLHVDYGDIEHMLPKTISSRLRFDYANLTIACGVCNTKKGEYYDQQLPLLNPYDDEPNDHLVAAGPMVLRRASSDRGLVTEKTLDLNRSALFEKRKERIESVTTLLDQLARTRSSAIREVLLDQLNQECLDEREYAFVVRSYLTAMLRESDAEVSAD